MKNLFKQMLRSIKKKIPRGEKESEMKVVYPTEEELNEGIDNLKINGFSLPRSIVKRIKEGTWKEPNNKKNLGELIIRNCTSEKEAKCLKEMLNSFTLYSLRQMKNESESLYKWLHPKWDKERVMFLGKEDATIYPGNIEHNKVILFADFGHGSDTAFALDYREDATNPIVILEYWGENPVTDNRWKKIADTFEDFEKIIWREN